MHARNLRVVLGLLALSLTSASYADDTVYENSARLGAYWVQYHVEASDISGPFVPPGANIRLKDIYTPYFGYVRRLNEHLGVELALGAPPLTKTVGKGPAELGSVPYNGQTITTARWFAPTVLLEWSFFPETARLRPYIGAGINYTSFYSRKSTAAGDAATGGPTTISLPASAGPAVTAGLDYRLTDRFHVYASYSYSDVYTNLTANTAGVIRRSSINFNPTALVVSAGYSF